MRKTKEAAALTREQLVDSALALFLEHGYAGVSLNQIAEAQGLTRGAFYWHFKSKEDIMRAICERESHFITTLMVELFTLSGLPPDQHLEKVLTAVINNFFGNKRYRDFVELTWFKMEHLANDQVNQFKTRSNVYFVEECQKIIDRGIREQVFKKEEHPSTWAVHLAVIINGIYRLYFITPQYMTPKTARAVVRQALDTVIGE